MSTVQPALPPEGYAMTTAQILYRIPDFRHRVMEYFWRDFDLAPDYPELNRFLETWQKTGRSALVAVTITQIQDRPGAANGPLFLLN